MRQSAVFIFLTCLGIACGGGGASIDSDSKPQSMVATPRADDGKGIGEIKEVNLNDPLNAAMVERGRAIFDMKCAACHKLTEQRVVGPGFKGLTERRKPEWIMNMITNVDVMLEQDPTALALLKECLVRMPNQNLSIGDARDVLEFAYANDGRQVGE
jgi:cytochrome c